MKHSKPDDYADIIEFSKQAARFIPYQKGQLTESDIKEMLQKYWNNSLALWSIAYANPVMQDFVKVVILRRKKFLDQRNNLIKGLVIGIIIAIIVYFTGGK